MKVLELIGLPVYDIFTGKKVSKVKDVWITEQWMISHLELESSHRFSRKLRMIAWEHISAFGEDAAMIKSRAVIEETEQVHEGARTFLIGPRHLKEIPVVTEEGNQLGSIADVYFRPNMGNTVTGLEITDGILSDLLEGRQQLDWTSQMRLGDDAVVIVTTA